MAQFDPPATAPPGAHHYATENPSYSLLDASVHFGMIRALRCRRVLELGSGHSTLLSAQAGRLNAAEGHPLELVVYDPYPGVVDESLPGLHALHRSPAQQVPLTVFERLEADDVLFVDTTHTVKLGSEVNFILLEILPRLKPGVVVHVHDVFLPFEYPQTWIRELGLYWNEQYLLQAFLAHNESWEVLAAVHALSRLRADELTALLPTQHANRTDGGSFWMRRTA